MSSRFLSALFAGVIALMIALDCGLPLWRHLPIGDASDFAFTTFFAVWYLVKALRSEGVLDA